MKTTSVPKKNKLDIPQSHPTCLFTPLVSDSFYLLQPVASADVMNSAIQHFSEA